MIEKAYELNRIHITLHRPRVTDTGITGCAFLMDGCFTAGYSYGELSPTNLISHS